MHFVSTESIASLKTDFLRAPKTLAAQDILVAQDRTENKEQTGQRRVAQGV